MTSNLTVKMIREIAKASGIAHAEMVLENAESQAGRAKMANVRAEFEAISDGLYRESIADSHLA